MPWDGEEFWNSPHVAEMTNDEALLYQWALWQNWKAGSIPTQIAALRRMLPGRFARCFDTAWKVVMPRFEIGTDGRLRNARVARDLCAAAERVAKFATAGKASAVSRRAKLASVASEQGSTNERRSNVVPTSFQLGEERRGEETSDLSTDQGAASAPVPRKRKPREPNVYELAWYDAMRAHTGTEPAQLAAHGSISLGRLGKSFGAHAIASKLRALLADEKARKFATPKYLEEHWDTLGGGLFSPLGHNAPPEVIADIRRVLSLPPAPGDKNREIMLREARERMAKYKLSEAQVMGGAA